VAGLNAHAGENGLFGWEESREIAPAIEDAKALGIDADGPVPPDTVFVKCQGGQYDVVVAMYHDQGQIALKSLGFNRCVTVSGGLPYPITTPAQGTAYDIAGKNIAETSAFLQAVNIVKSAINRQLA
jgi:4-hydroxythreonine-4-phosphate dehydrogenase